MRYSMHAGMCRPCGCRSAEMPQVGKSGECPFDVRLAHSQPAKPSTPPTGYRSGSAAVSPLQMIGWPDLPMAGVKFEPLWLMTMPASQRWLWPSR